VPAWAGIAGPRGRAVIENCAVRASTLLGAVLQVINRTGRSNPRQVVLAAVLVGAFLRNQVFRCGILSVRENVAATEPCLPEVYAGAVSDGAGRNFRRREDGGLYLAPPGAPELSVGPDAFRRVASFMTAWLADLWLTAPSVMHPKAFPECMGQPNGALAAGRPIPVERMRIWIPPPNMAKIRRCLRDFSAMFPDLVPIKA